MGAVKRGVGLLLLATAGFLAWSWTGERRDRGERSEELPVRVASVRPTALGTEGPPPVDPDSVDRDRDLHGVVVRKADGKPVAGARLRPRPCGPPTARSGGSPW